MPRVREITPTVHVTMCRNCIKFSAALNIVSERYRYRYRYFISGAPRVAKALLYGLALPLLQTRCTRYLTRYR